MAGVPFSKPLPPAKPHFKTYTKQGTSCSNTQAFWETFDIHLFDAYRLRGAWCVLL